MQALWYRSRLIRPLFRGTRIMGNDSHGVARRMVMKLLGFQIPNFTFPGIPNDRLFDHVAKLATTAERSGFDAVFVMDHFYQLPNIGPRTDPMREGHTALAGIPPRPTTIRRGTLGTGVTHRNRARVAKAATPLDRLSP